MAKRKRAAGARGRRGPASPRGPASVRGRAGGLSQEHVDRIGQLRKELQEAIQDAEPVKALQRQVEGALKQGDELAYLRGQLESVQKEQRIQFQRIAQIQAQLDQLMGILMKH